MKSLALASALILTGLLAAPQVSAAEATGSVNVRFRFRDFLPHR